MKKKKTHLILFSIIFPSIFVNFLIFTLAWSPPPGPPPTSNTPSFLSVSNQTQFKEGALGIGGLLQAFVFQLYPDGGTRPDCNASSRGMMWLEEGGEGEGDVVSHCLKGWEESYEWITVAEGYTWSCGDSFEDERDSNTYSTVEIGDQCWMQENLAYLPSVVGSATGSTTVSHYYVYGYNGTDVNAAKATGNYSTYGVLYNWPAAMGGSTTEGVQGVCPDGWYLPTDADYKELEMYLGMTQEDADTLNAWRNSGSVGSKLGTFTSGGNNSSGFTALAGGRRITEGSFSSELTSAFFWSSSPSTGNTVSRNLSSSNVGVGRNALNRANGFSVRCMRDFDFEDEEGLYKTTEYVDGITFMVKKTLPNTDDYKTKEDWENWEENGVFNIKGLRSNTEYSLKISALYGDLTESVPSEPVSATTSLGSLHFRIGLGKEDGEDTNFNPPYEIFFDGGFRLVRGAGVKKSDKLIWSLINTNSNRGVTMVKKGEYGGLYNEDLEYTISSVSGDINSETEGIGLKNFSKSQLFSDDDGLLSKIEVEEEYNSEEENMVGNIEDVFKRIYFSSGPIHTGKTSIRIFAKAALDTPEVNYDEDITFVLVPKY